MKNQLLKSAIVLLLILFSFTKILAQTDTLTLLHVNDTHSCLAPLAPRTAALEGTVGGIARAASVIGMNRMTEKNVLVLHGGDFSIGDLFYNNYFGVPELQLMKEIGFDAMTIGNHEFDLMPETLGGVLQTAFVESSFPLLSANAIMEDPVVAPLKNYIQPYTIKEFGDLKIGIFGLTTPETNVFSLPAPVVIDTNIIAMAMSMVDTLTAKGCKVIICLSHLGVYYDQLIAENIPGINVFVSGHDHYLLNEPIEIINPLGKKTWIVQADAFYTNVGKMKLEIQNQDVKLIGYELIPLDVNIPEEPTVKTVVDGLILEMEVKYGIPFYSQAIGEALEDFEEVAQLDGIGDFRTDVGKLVTNAFRKKTNTQIALTLGGSTAQKIYKGPIVPADVFRMIGYGFNTINGLGFRIATFKITGEELWKGLEICVSQVELNDELLAQVSGMSYTFDISQPQYARVTGVEIAEQPIDPTAIYTVTANEFVINALPLFGVYITDVVLMEDVTEFQVVCDYIIKRGTITDLKEAAPSIPIEYRLEQNYPNPFNPSTVISYQLPIARQVTLKIYNLLGQEVATLINQEQSAGTHKVEWNATGLASGMYIYRLEAGSYSQMKKMILMK